MQLRSRQLLTTAPAILLVALFILFWLGLHKDPRKLPSVLIGKPMPSFASTTLLHDKEITDKEFINHITLLNVWSSWCYPCRQEHDLLLSLQHDQKLKSKYHLQLVGLNYKDNNKAAKQFIDTMSNPYDKIIFDPKGELAMNFGVYGTPETFIIDQRGIIRYRYTGPVNNNTWQNILLPIIKKYSGKIG